MTDDDFQIHAMPAAAVGAFAYCPRLFHYQHVQGEWRDTEDTIEGRIAHRRVDAAAGRVDGPGDDGARTIHARSVAVGSSQFGVSAVVDVLEGQGRRVTPVEYKRGEAPDVPEGAWEPDRVQVCLQGLVLGDSGYECDEGVVYYVASRKRVRVPFTPDLLRLTLDMLAKARRTEASQTVPEPLVNSPKCPRCSLVSICLPDETALLTGRREPSATVRRLIPASDQQMCVYVQEQGCQVGVGDDRLRVRRKGETLMDVRLLDVGAVALFGNVQMTAQALRALAARDVIVAHLSYGGWLTAITTPPPRKNVALRARQFALAADEAASLGIARAIVAGKLANARTLLRRNASTAPEGALSALASLRRGAERAESHASLLGVEGAGARAYFGAFSGMIDDRSDAVAFDFNGRNRRPPTDPVNALLSFVYALMLKDFVAALALVGFDPYCGFLHKMRFGRPSLALDLMEEFRPIVADSVVISLINRGEIRPSDFLARAGAVALTDAGRRKVIEAYERRLDQTVTHPMFGYTVSYLRVFEIQARILARVVTGEIAQYVPFRTR